MSTTQRTVTFLDDITHTSCHSDYRYNEFDGYEHPEWPAKRVITADTKAALEGTQTKLILLVTGMFLGWLSAPGRACVLMIHGAFWLTRSTVGIDIENNVYTSLGPSSVRFATTAEEDIARSIAQLAILSLDPATASTVPTDLRIAGQNVSYEEIRDAVACVKGVPKGQLRSRSLEQFDSNLKENPTDNILDYIWRVDILVTTMRSEMLIEYAISRVLMGQGKMDFSSENANEFVNPGQSLWKWKTVEDQLRSSL